MKVTKQSLRHFTPYSLCIETLEDHDALMAMNFHAAGYRLEYCGKLPSKYIELSELIEEQTD